MDTGNLPSSPAVVIRRKGVGGAVLDGFGSVSPSVSASQTVPSTMPPPPSRAMPLSHDFMLPPGVPSSSGVTSAASVGVVWGREEG